MQLAQFDGVNQWPKKTNIWCYHCCHPFDTTPLSMPSSFDTCKDSYKCDGIFCSFECMKTYNLELNDTYTNTRFVLIEQLRRRFSTETSSTKFAPRRVELAIFGGDLTIAQFRCQNKSIPRTKYIPPMSITQAAFDKHETFSIRKNDAIAPTTSAVKNEPIKLQRAKKVDQNTLESTMGLFKSMSTS